MKSEIKDLEFQRLINDIIYLKEELILKEKISSIIEEEFQEELDSLINKDHYIKEQWETSIKNNVKNNKLNKKKEEIKEVKNDYVKKLYRDIVKKSHPDKIDDETKNNTYIMATESYEKNNIIDLIYYAKELGIEYNRENLDIDEIKSKIDEIKSKIKLYETSTHYKWYYNDKDSKIIKNYIAKQFLTI